MGYRFDQKNKKCVVGSSIIVPDESDGINPLILYGLIGGVIFLIVIFIIIFCYISRKKKRLNSSDIDLIFLNKNND